MTFILPSGKRPGAFIVPSVGSPPSSSSQGFTNGRGFLGALGRAARPNLNINTQINLSLSSKPNNSGDSPPPNKPPNNNNNSSTNQNNGNGGRPHKSKTKKNANSGGKNKKGYYAPDEQVVGPQSFSTGVKSGTIINPYRSSSSVKGSDLFLLAGSFLSDLVKPSETQRFVGTDLYFKVVTKIQQNINYKVDKTFTENRFLKYLSRLTSGLQLYYCIDSILAFNVDKFNVNAGMLNLRRSLDADTLSQHQRLKRTLLSVPIPPNLNVFISYMYQNFKFDYTKDSPLFKLSFRSIFHSGSPQCLSPDYYDVIIDELMEDTQTIAILNKSFPVMQVNELIPSSSEPLYDKNFMSFWYNSNVVHYDLADEVIHHSRNVTNSDTPTYYGHFCENDVDGAFYACSSLYDEQTKTISPGLWIPLINKVSYSKNVDFRQHSNLLCFDSTQDGFYSINSHRVAAQSGLFHPVWTNDLGLDYLDKEATQVQNWTSEVFISPSAQEVQTHCISNTNQAVSETLLYLFSGITD